MSVVMAAVPEADAQMALQVVPGAVVETLPFGAGTVERHSGTRVLSVMIHDQVTTDLLARLPHLEAVITRSDGFDHLPLEWLRRRGVAAYHLEGYATGSVAQLAVAMLVASARRVPEGMAETRAGGWDRSGLVGRHLEEMTVGVVGTGRIGSAVAQILTSWGVRVVGHDLVHREDLAALPGFAYAADLEDLLTRCDAVSLHVPLDGSTRDLIDARAVARMRPGAILVNTARGAVVDPEAVAHGLRSGHLQAFAADTLPDEPRVPHLALLKDLPNVLLTPHLGAHNHATLRRRYEATARIAQAVLEGRSEEVSAYRVA